MERSADSLTGRTADQWFADAMRWYLEGHQGCPCCQGQHCVFRSQWGARIEFYCTACDFSAAQDGESRACTATHGERSRAPGVVLDCEAAFERPSSLTRN